MNRRVQLVVITTSAAAALCAAAAGLFFRIGPDLGAGYGLVFWIGLTLVGSVLPVRLPHGTVVTVSAAPIMASIILGGPAAAAVVAAIGATDTRELRGQVPWYGTLFNHSAAVVSAVMGGVAYVAIVSSGRSFAQPVASIFELAALLVGSTIFYVCNGFLVVAAVGARTETPMRVVWAHDLGAIAASWVGLAPLALLMAQIFTLPNGVGWWATPLFVIPLFTTRLAYSRYVETRELFEQTIAALANAVDARDRYTRGHSGRVSHIAEAMGRVMRLSEPEIERIKWAGLLHDVGKIGVRDSILLKPGPLDRDERILMNQHPAIGAEIVAPASQLSAEAPLIRAHHEWINGSGYPDGLEALDIPLGARILTIADAYEAMTSSRPYRTTPLTHEHAVGELEKYAGIQFDADIVPILVGLDRETLDRRTTSEDDLPTMLRQHDPRDAVAAAVSQPPSAQRRRSAVHRPVPGGQPSSRRALASDDAT